MDHETIAAAMAVQEAQRRLGVRVQSVAEIAGEVAPRRPLQCDSDRPALPAKRVARYGADAVVVPFGAGDKGIGQTMKSNATISFDGFQAIEDGLSGAGATGDDLGGRLKFRGGDADVLVLENNMQHWWPAEYRKEAITSSINARLIVPNLV